METTAVGVTRDAATRLINESILGAVLIVTIAVSAIIIWMLWRAWKDERVGRAADNKRSSEEIKELNKMLNASLRESIQRENEADKRADAVISVLEKALGAQREA